MSLSSCALGVDLGGQSVKLAIVDSEGGLHQKRQVAIDASRDARTLTRQIIEEIQTSLANAAAARLGPRAVGMVMPGYMDRQRSRLTFSANLRSLSGSNLLQDLRDAIPLPMAFDADSNAAALAESRFGVGRGVGRLIVAVIGTGIGAGVVIDGKILRIREHIAGSLGHVIVNATGPRCRCGGRGCVEAYASGPALERRASEVADAEPGSTLALLREQAGRLSGVEIAAALSQGDAAAARVVAECGWWLGVAVASWAVIYAPDRVVIGGGIAGLGEPLVEAVRRGMKETGQPAMVERIEISLAALGADAGIVGAACVAMTEYGGHASVL